MSQHSPNIFRSSAMRPQFLRKEPMFQQFKNKMETFFFLKKEWQTCIIWYTEVYSLSCKNREANSFMPNTRRMSKKNKLFRSRELPSLPG